MDAQEPNRLRQFMMLVQHHSRPMPRRDCLQPGHQFFPRPSRLANMIPFEAGSEKSRDHCVFTRLVGLTDGQLRFIGLASVVIGVAACWALSHA